MIIPTAVELPDDTTLHAAALQAAASHLHLVIDADGDVKLTPLLLPGMQKIAVCDKQPTCAEAA